MKRYYVNKKGEVKTYTYERMNARTEPTNAERKRNQLIDFMRDHQDDINKLPTKTAKIQFITNTINNGYTYSFSMVYNMLNNNNVQQQLTSQIVNNVMLNDDTSSVEEHS